MAGSATMQLREPLDPVLARELDVVLRLLGRYERHGARFHEQQLYALVEQRIASPLSRTDKEDLLAYVVSLGACQEKRGLVPTPVYAWARPRSKRVSVEQIALGLEEPANDNTDSRSRRRRT